MIEGAESRVEHLWMDGWFETVDRRLEIAEERMSRHLKPPFPPQVEALAARLDFTEKLLGLCVGAIFAFWLVVLFLILHH